MSSRPQVENQGPLHADRSSSSSFSKKLKKTFRSVDVWLIRESNNRLVWRENTEPSDLQQWRFANLKKKIVACASSQFLQQQKLAV